MGTKLAVFHLFCFFIGVTEPFRTIIYLVDISKSKIHLPSITQTYKRILNDKQHKKKHIFQHRTVPYRKSISNRQTLRINSVSKCRNLEKKKIKRKLPPIDIAVSIWLEPIWINENIEKNLSLLVKSLTNS